MEYYPVGEKGNKSVLLGFQSSNEVIPAGAARGQISELGGATGQIDMSDEDALGRELQKL